MAKFEAHLTNYNLPALLEKNNDCDSQLTNTT